MACLRYITSHSKSETYPPEQEQRQLHMQPVHCPIQEAALIKNEAGVFIKKCFRELAGVACKLLLR